MEKNKKPLKLSTIMLCDLIKTNALLARTIEAQQTEISYLNLRIDGLLTWEKNRKKYTNKKYINRATPTNSYKRIKGEH